MRPAPTTAIDDLPRAAKFWDALLADGGEPSQCGWLTDRFGVTWQVIPTALMELTTRGTPAQSQAVTQAMLGMVKLDVAALQRAFAEAEATVAVPEMTPVSFARLKPAGKAGLTVKLSTAPPVEIALSGTIATFFTALMLERT